MSTHFPPLPIITKVGTINIALLNGETSDEDGNPIPYKKCGYQIDLLDDTGEVDVPVSRVRGDLEEFITPDQLQQLSDIMDSVRLLAEESYLPSGGT